jgi:hypothetical protein
MWTGEKRLIMSEITVHSLLDDNARLLKATKMAYQKHVMNDPDIGWEELSDVLLDTLCTVLEEDGYRAWIASLKNDKVQR